MIAIKNMAQNGELVQAKNLAELKTKGYYLYDKLKNVETGKEYTICKRKDEYFIIKSILSNGNITLMNITEDITNPQNRR